MVLYSNEYIVSNSIPSRLSKLSIRNSSVCSPAFGKIPYIFFESSFVVLSTLSWLHPVNNSIKMHKKFGKKSSASAEGWLTVHQYEDTAACMQAIKARYGKIYATHLGVQSNSLYELNLAESVALVFGNEHEGVTEECLSYCDGNFIIPQVGMVQSLNISVACAVTLYEAYRQREIAGYYTGAGRLPEQQHNELATRWGLFDEA